MNILLIVLALIALAFLAVFMLRAVGGNFRLVEDWKRAYRFYSVWAIALIGALPDIYNAIAASGLLSGGDAPDDLVWAVRLAAVGGLLLRLVQQYKPDPDDTDQAGA